MSRNLAAVLGDILGGPEQTYRWTGQVARRSGTRLLLDSPHIFYPSCVRPCLGGYVHVHTNVRHPDLMAVLMDQPDLNDPEIVFLDEPMSGLDPIGRRDVRDIMLRLRERGTTVFFSSPLATTLFTSPIRSASLASIMSPVKISSFALP